ncbi:uncharacterized protein [Eurosta solidaginis]|uniref:uncharacterized protein n=1 Tax=Eurosta solidaginis TaxID=178769 RepID=UPI0035306703
MLSFFAKKKQSVDISPEEAIQGPADPTQTNDGGCGSDDFIFVERKPLDDHSKLSSQGMVIYPPMPSIPWGRLPAQTPGYLPKYSGSDNATPVPYVHGVPFQLAPQLSSKSDFEVTQLQVDSILALLTRQMSIDETEEYNFALERSIQNECY